MIRIVLFSLLSYMFGHGHFDGYRPHLIDVPLQSFHADVNRTSQDFLRATDRLFNPTLNSAKSITASLLSD